MPSGPGADGRCDRMDRDIPASLGAPAGPAGHLCQHQEGRPDMSYELRMERLFDAPPEVVFDAFVDPDAQGELYADDEGDPRWVVESEMDLRDGGTWSIAFGKAGAVRIRGYCVIEWRGGL